MKIVRTWVGIVCLGIFLFSAMHAQVGEKPLSEWTVLTYMQANNDLAAWGYYSLSHMMSGIQKSQGVNALVQWDKPETGKLWRYKVVPGEKEELGTIDKLYPLDPAQALVDAMQWAQTNYPAKKYALIFWNHGSGIVDYEQYRIVSLEQKRFKLPPRSLSSDQFRAILYDDSQQTVLTNQGMVKALTQIKENLGQKIDFVGMDACFMAMFEVGYQIKECAKFLVAAQEATSGEGLPYGALFHPLTMHAGRFEPHTLAQAVVHGADAFYRNKEGYQDYTYSAFDLSMADSIRQNIDQLVAAVDVCHQCDAQATYDHVMAARRTAHPFYWPDYIDLYSLYQGLGKQVDEWRNSTNTDSGLLDALVVLKTIVDEGIALLNGAVIANASGLDHVRAKGVSIYYPIHEEMHSTYLQTIFAQDCAWVKFVAQYH